MQASLLFTCIHDTEKGVDRNLYHSKESSYLHAVMTEAQDRPLPLMLQCPYAQRRYVLAVLPAREDKGSGFDAS